MGPVIIFDKSALQGLNVDEAVWLDTFFLTNITPLFWIETLADLEVELRKPDGRTAEDIVGNLSLKTPDLSSKMNVHHETLLSAELFDGYAIDMESGRPIISGGAFVELDGKNGVVFQQTKEEEAFARWQAREFLDLERTLAKKWRQGLAHTNFDDLYKQFRQAVEGNKPKTMLEAKQRADKIIDAIDQRGSFIAGMEFLGVPAQDEILLRWDTAKNPPIRHFAPYFCHVLSVELSFYFAMGSDLISRDRPSHKVDLAYLYYLPFCMVFASEDKLHAALVPPFLREFQTFCKGTELKNGLRKINEHYNTLPQEVRDRGISSFAIYPPAESDFFVSGLWDKYLPRWRTDASDLQRKHGQPVSRETLQDIPIPHRSCDAESEQAMENNWEVDSMTLVRLVDPQKGNWKRFPPEVTGSTVT